MPCVLDLVSKWGVDLLWCSHRIGWSTSFCRASLRNNYSWHWFDFVSLQRRVREFWQIGCGSTNNFSRRSRETRNNGSFYRVRSVWLRFFVRIFVCIFISCFCSYFQVGLVLSLKGCCAFLFCLGSTTWLQRRFLWRMSEVGTYGTMFIRICTRNGGFVWRIWPILRINKNSQIRRRQLYEPKHTCFVLCNVCVCVCVQPISWKETLCVFVPKVH